MPETTKISANGLEHETMRNWPDVEKHLKELRYLNPTNSDNYPINTMIVNANLLTLDTAIGHLHKIAGKLYSATFDWHSENYSCNSCTLKRHGLCRGRWSIRSIH